MKLSNLFRRDPESSVIQKIKKGADPRKLTETFDANVSIVTRDATGKPTTDIQTCKASKVPDNASYDGMVSSGAPSAKSFPLFTLKS